jgi:pyruvate,orthophosphate dikinase
MTSHAAVVARGMGTCCVAGCQELTVDAGKKVAKIGDITLREGDPITIDGSTGEIMLGELPTTSPELTGQFGKFMEWVDDVKTLKVRTNADTPKDSEVARKFGAEGIGLCRTEHMFFEGDRIDAMREMILAEDIDGRKKALAKILPMQKGDFKGIFRVMDGYPVTVRLLDPPLHEFLPHTDEEIADLSKKMGVPAERLKIKSSELHEFNPMLGHRGCRLGVTFPEIYAMQTQAIMEAACELTRDENIEVIPEIEIPLVGHVNELRQMRAVCEKVANEVIERSGQKVKYYIGTMIELPRAAISADEIAKYADFFSFGTNDLTQTTFGFSRDDAGKFIREYVEKKILSDDPFVSIDRFGVGKLMRIGVELGRKTKPELEIGICGEHGGEAKSVAFCHEIGLNYVSCSPYRVPIARLAAAQAALSEKE